MSNTCGHSLKYATYVHARVRGADHAYKCKDCGYWHTGRNPGLQNTRGLGMVARVFKRHNVRIPKDFVSLEHLGFAIMPDGEIKFINRFAEDEKMRRRIEERTRNAY